MATSISAGPAWAMDNIATDASVVRTFDVAAMAYNAGTLSAVATPSGVLPGPNALEVTAPGGMVVTVSAGFAIIAATLTSNGAYRMGLTASGNLTVASADPTNPRIDLVCATIIDLDDSSSVAEVQIITGTPAPSPTVPSLPAMSLALAEVTVPALASSIGTGDIDDQRVWTAPPGGIIPVNGLSTVPAAGYEGAYFHDQVTHRLVHAPAGTPEQPILLPFATVTEVSNSGSDPGTASHITVLSATVNCDGETDIEIYIKWASIYANSGSGSSFGTADMRLYIDGNQVDSVIAAITNGGSGTPGMSGGSYSHRTSAATGDTPTAGAHTITWQMYVNYIGSDFIFIHQGANYPAILRVSPVPL